VFYCPTADYGGYQAIEAACNRISQAYHASRYTISCVYMVDMSCILYTYTIDHLKYHPHLHTYISQYNQNTATGLNSTSTSIVINGSCPTRPTLHSLNALDHTRARKHPHLSILATRHLLRVFRNPNSYLSRICRFEERRVMQVERPVLPRHLYI